MAQNQQPLRSGFIDITEDRNAAKKRKVEEEVRKIVERKNKFDDERDEYSRKMKERRQFTSAEIVEMVKHASELSFKIDINVCTSTQENMEKIIDVILTNFDVIPKV